MRKNAIVFTANTLHVAQANLMIESLFDEDRGNFKGDLWVISTHLSKRCRHFLDSKGIRYLINPLTSFQSWEYREEIARSQPEFISGKLNLDDAFLLYRNKRMSKLIICDWVEKFGQNYDAVALCDNDLYFQRDVNELFSKTAETDSEVVWYWQEENKNLPGTNLWVKNFHYTRLHDTDGMDFGEHEINIGFIISAPQLMRQVFTRVGALFSSCNIELFRDCRWHDQDLVRVIRAQDPQLFRLFEEGDVLHLCNGGQTLVEETAPQQFYHKKTQEKPYIVHFAGGAWKPFHSIAASYKVDADAYFFMEEQRESFDQIRHQTDYDPFDRLSVRFSQHNMDTKSDARSRWMKLKAESEKKSMLFFSWLDTGSHQPLRDRLASFLDDDRFDLAIIDGNVRHQEHEGLVVEDLPDLLAFVTHTVRNGKFGRSFGYKREDVPEEAVSGAIESLVKEYGCSRRNARAVANAAYIYLSKALDFYRPDVVVSWAAYALSPRILRYLCRERSIPFMTMEMGVLPNTIAFECLGHMGSNWVARDPEAFNKLVLEQQDYSKARAYLSEIVAARPSRNIRLEIPEVVQNRLERIKASGRKIVVFIGSNCAASGHVPYDEAARIYHSPFYRDNEDVVRHLSEVFAEDQDIHLIYKPHPITVTRGLDLSGEYPNVTILQDVNLDDCLNIADLAVVKVSQGCYEALLRDTPVLMVGRNQISGSGAVYELSGKDALRAEVLAALEGGLSAAQKAAFEMHVARLLRYYLYAVSGFELARPQKQVLQDMEALLYATPPTHLAPEQAALAAYRADETAADPAAPKISIIMPVYNGEEYLVDCIGSLLSQSFDNFELICVNNGSTDSSQEILDYFATQDARIRLLHMDEPNQCAARNFGTQKARGDYLHFVDCDDLLARDAYAQIVSTIKETGADVLYFFFDDILDRPDQSNPRHREFKNYLPKADLFRMEEDHKHLFAQYPFPWAKVFNAEFFRKNKLYFDLDCANYEDNPQNLRTLLSTQNIHVLNRSLYKHRIVPNSISQSVNPRVFGMLDAVRLMNEIYMEFGRYSEFQRSYVPYKLHLLHFAWTRLPEDLRAEYWPAIKSMFLPGDEEYFARDELFSMFSYLTEEKVAFTRRAISGEWYELPMAEPEAAPEPVEEAGESGPEPAVYVNPYPNPVEERVVKFLSRTLVRNPRLFSLGKRLYRSVRPLQG